MELKFRCTGMASTPITWFKSHLYGIEITDYLVQRLKRYLFKSHLYGIEICGICSFRVTCQVSLNRTFMELKCHIIHIVCISLLMFKSHLYGIEIYVYNSAIVEKLCLNRTFMELKFSKLVIAYSFLVNV